MLRTLYPIIRLTPKPVIHGVYRVIEAFDPLLIRAYRRRTGNDRPIPPMRLRARVGSRWVDDFVAAGGRCAAAISDALAQSAHTDIQRPSAILDFGCGCGRTLQHLARVDPVRFHGCDVDPAAIAWMQQSYDPARFKQTCFDPPLPFAVGSFDLIYSVSIFSHLNEPASRRWIAELRRVLKPGGLFLPTTHGRRALEMFIHGPIYTTLSMNRRLRSHRPLSDEGFIFEPYEDFKSNGKDFPGINDAYGLTFIDEAYIRREWSEHFELLGIHEATVDGLQDVVVLRAR